MIDFDGTWTTRGAVILRTIETKDLLLGVLSEHVLTEKDNKKNKGSGQVWVGNIILMPVKRFYLPESYGGWQAEDLLRANIDVSTMEEVK
jgi:hypothetical protein